LNSQVRLYAVLLLFTLGVAPASAASIFSTLGPGDAFSNSGAVFRGPSDLSTPPDIANSFVADITAPVASVDLPLLLVLGSPATVTVNIAADNAGVPGTILESSSVAALGGGTPTLVNAPFAGTLILNGGTQYWVWLAAGGDAVVRWSVTDPAVTYPLFRSSNSGSTWQQSGGANSLRQAYRVNGVDVPSEVPEPSTWLLISGGLGGLLWWRRRQASAGC